MSTPEYEIKPWHTIEASVRRGQRAAEVVASPDAKRIRLSESMASMILYADDQGGTCEVGSWVPTSEALERRGLIEPIDWMSVYRNQTMAQATLTEAGRLLIGADA